MRLNLKLLSQGTAILTLIAFLSGCAKDENATPENLPIDERGITITGSSTNTLIYGLNDLNEIVMLMSGPPANELSRVPITGLRDGDAIIAIDIRPGTKQIYGVSLSSMIYKIDPNTGVAQAVSLTPFSPSISGAMVGFDFEPKTDRIRLVTDNDQNLRISPVTGAVTNIDFPLNPALPTINSIAYSSLYSLNGSLLYDVDIAEGNLYRQNPNTGTLTRVGSLGLKISGEGGFDISRSNVAFAVLFASGQGPVIGGEDLSVPDFRLFKINLNNGVTTNFGKVKNLIGLAIP